MSDIVIVSAARTPVGSFLGALSSLPAHELGAVAIKAALERAGVKPEEVDEVIMGQVLQAGAGQGPARQAAVAAGVPVESPAWSLNQLCGSGLRAVALGLQQITAGDAKIVVAGGQESMSQAPHAANLRNGQKMGDLSFTDTMIKDGLWDAFNGYHMGQTAENVATSYGISRAEQDEWGVLSQNRAEAAIASGFYAREITPYTRKDGSVVDRDDSPRPGVTLEAVSALQPAFRTEGTVTAGNACPLNDGAAAMVVMSDARARELELEPLARVVSTGVSALSPELMGMGPVESTRRALATAGLTMADIDLVELNEAFAVQVIASARELGIDPEKLNVHGGAIALGHPFGMTGARMATTLINGLQERDKTLGLATLCVGGGQGMAVVLERLR